MDALARALGRPQGSLLVKRDDATGLAAGGNKVRKLEYVLAHAQAQGVDWLVTGAGVQSNAARATAAAAAKLGMGCTLVLDGAPPADRSGNLVLDDILGAEVRFCPAADFATLDAALQATADDLADAGRQPYVVAVGASTPLGSLGYVACADELTGQAEFDVVVVATGSSGTHAGLVAGLGDHARVHGVQVGVRHDLLDRVRRLAADTAALAGRPEPVGDTQLDHTQLGAGYGAHTPAAFEAITLAARTEGLILDPVYTGKAMASLIAGCRTGRWRDDEVIVFVHTGGMPGLLSVNHAGPVAQFARARSGSG
jgi:1-aminocyclopropane-1-carboxylate deaminase/D-cysteine desulfhydrase-like pyridoxal-dependent ACC family enzyme